MRPPATVLATAAAALLALAAAVVLHRTSPAPTAEVARGTEDAFASGLHRRELPPRQPPLRWTTERAVLRFDHLPATPAVLDVAVAGQQAPVVVAVDGVVVGSIPRGVGGGRFEVRAASGRRHEVELRTPVFVAGDGRGLGARLGRVRWEMGDRGAPPPALAALVVVPAVAAVAAGILCGLGPLLAGAFAAALTAFHCATLWPSGLVRSPWAGQQAVLLVAAIVLAAAFARIAERRHPGAAPWALVALTGTLLVQGLLATSPAMVVSDAVFHANNLGRVAGGDYFPTSVTQHARPFRFPYGVSFYALLVPLLRAGVDGLTLVRVGAAGAGVAASAALFLVLAGGYGVAAAGVGVLLLQLLPATFDVGYSYGNLSNAFGHAATVGFFAWWARPRARVWAIGALLLATAATAHFSTLIVSAVLAAGLALARGRALDRTRALALAFGLGLGAGYYVPHVPLMVSQLPRLAERGEGTSPGVFAAARAQVRSAVLGWGVAAIVLAWYGRPWRREKDDDLGRALDRDLTAWWIACGILALPAIASPLEVRYLYSLTVPVAAAAGLGTVLLHRRGGRARYVAWGLVAGQLVIGGANLAEAVFSRYRPAG
jgi:hypothetical protein